MINFVICTKVTDINSGEREHYYYEKHFKIEHPEGFGQKGMIVGKWQFGFTGFKLLEYWLGKAMHIIEKLEC